MELRMWDSYSELSKLISNHMCSICGNEAHGSFYSREWYNIKLCFKCFEKLTEGE